MGPLEIRRAAAMTVQEYDPGTVIDAVNYLQPLTNDEALARIEESQSGSLPSTGLFWVLRVLFEVPAETGFPPVRIGQPNIPPPADCSRLPRFPIIVVRDLPFLAVRAFKLGGKPEALASHVEYYRAHGRLRNKPLVRPRSLIGIDEQFMARWRKDYGDEHTAAVRKTIAEQLRRLARASRRS